MGHVPAHHFADAATGRLSARKLARLNAHTQTCDQCRATQERIGAARVAFADIREQEAPDLHWEHIGARIYWATASQQRSDERASQGQTVTKARPRRLWFGVAGASVIAVGAAVIFVLSSAHTLNGQTVALAPAAQHRASHRIVKVKTAKKVVTPIRVKVPVVQGTAVAGVVTFTNGDVQLDNVKLGFDASLRAGHKLTTKRGSVAVQFDRASGFWVAPNSAVELRSFDSKRVELVVKGSVTVNITKRSPGQYFAVVAGNHRVEVRGTAFQVNFRNNRLNVSCVRGHVVVAGKHGAVDVRAGQMLKLADDDALTGLSADTLRGARLSAVSKEAQFHMLPAWADASAMLATSSTLRVAANPGRIVKVDGVARGVGTFKLRVMSGRHHVEAKGSGKGRWLELGAGKVGSARITQARNVGAGRIVRKKQLSSALRGTAGLRRCLRSLAKQGMDKGTFIEFDIGITSAGTIRHLNIVRTNLSSRYSGCMSTYIENNVAFPKGPAATIRYSARF